MAEHMSPLDTTAPGTYGAKVWWPTTKIAAAGVTAFLVAAILGVLKAQLDVTVDDEILKGLGVTWAQAANLVVPLAVAYLWPRSATDNVPVHDPLERVPPETVEG